MNLKVVKYRGYGCEVGPIDRDEFRSHEVSKLLPLFRLAVSRIAELANTNNPKNNGDDGSWWYYDNAAELGFGSSYVRGPSICTRANVFGRNVEGRLYLTSADMHNRDDKSGTSTIVVMAPTHSDCRVRLLTREAYQLDSTAIAIYYAFGGGTIHLLRKITTPDNTTLGLNYAEETKAIAALANYGYTGIPDLKIPFVLDSRIVTDPTRRVGVCN